MVIGWDIGGAHVKVALVDDHGRVVRVLQTACPLWRGIEQLALALTHLLPELPTEGTTHGVTMTGELVDCFASRAVGVHAIVATLASYFGAANIRIFAGCAGFIAADSIASHHIVHIASANWLASVTLAARQCRRALFVDIGSTTTDILCIDHHRPVIQAYTDYERLVSGELFYTGIVRTSVMAVARNAVFNGRPMQLMAEHFATMADVYRLTCDLNEAHDQAETADGGPKTTLASALRLSRLTGYEFDEAELALWQAFAAQLKHQQRQQIAAACARQIQRLAADDEPLVLVGAGVGRFLVKNMAIDCNATYVDFNALCPPVKPQDAMQPADCAPAVAVAMLVLGGAT
ncbi:MAG: H4MPT-linked C1 transfer pathway protein [Methylomonas sp.]|nr:MAG: H4MPT-linked C1 transfer pathway protein [Methylomonas sp.]PPD24267.1 MAG: H4MPT-linked C1 transfer pathway protein [Methylomonas sp.]PPD32872.1 MAG: H4MPT-linked C1 transfer pathway protein [Methylomonas sp.]PPD37992.1 MAG: H4MPT-linked C1 transfer pathway protein [Methylomonas sp.]PPD55841.1 MAG: H4MPT-linked C1 transfer pathway protein [Methylomonas sp.]